MTAPAIIYCRLKGTTAEGVASESIYVGRMMSQPSRSIGITRADTLEVLVPLAIDATGPKPDGCASSWPPADWDLAKEISVEFGYVGSAGDTSEVVLMEGLLLIQQDPALWGVAVSDAARHQVAPDVDSVPTARVLTLATRNALWGDGRGGLIRKDVYNILRADGTHDPAASTSRTNSQLLEEAVAATGLLLSLDPGQADAINAFDPPAPIDWTCREAPAEIDALLARIGYAPIIAWDGGTLRIARLPKPGESQTPPSWLADNAEPYQLSQAVSLRGRTIVVHSGDTRSIAVSTLDLANLEWVWFDDKTKRWLNDAETATLYPGETQPGSIAAFRAADPAKAAQRSRIMRHLRITDAALRERLKLLVPFPAVSGGPTPVAGVGAIVETASCIAGAGGQLVQRPIERVEGARIHPGLGVISLPLGRAYVFLGAGSEAVGSINDALALDVDGDKTRLKITVAYQVGTPGSAGFGNRSYWSAWRCSSDAGATATVTRIEGAEADAALADPTSVFLRAEWLARVGTGTIADPQVFTWSNTAALHSAAQKIALARASASDLAPTGQIVVRGFHDRLPGVSWAWASRIAWVVDGPQAGTTIVTVGGHEYLGGEFADEQGEVRRSVAAGLGAYSLSGSSASMSDARLGGAPGTSDAPGAAAIAAGGLPVALRGAELRAPHEQAGGGPRIDDAINSGRTWLARITGATAISGASNRWEYDWQEVGLRNDRTAADSGRTHASTGYGKAINLAELRNASLGVQGNQVDLAQLTGTSLTIRPITGLVVEMSGPYGTSGAPYCVFNAANGLAGACT